MALSQPKTARVTLAENGKQLCSLDSVDAQAVERERDCRPRLVVEHLVLFNMPYLQGDQEAAILHALYDLQFKFHHILALTVGRKLNEVGDVTHALFMRFPTVEVLKAYYKSEALKHVICKMQPHLHGQITIDYVTGSGYLDTNQIAPICASVTFFKRKRDVCPDEMDCALHSLVATVDDASYVRDFTVGCNLFLHGDKYYTHGCAGYVKAVEDLDNLAKNPDYSKVLHDDVMPLSSSSITVNIMAFRPIRSCL